MIFEDWGEDRGSLKPVLNWANVCSPEHTSDTSTNIKHLVRRIWFGQSRLYFILNWLVMRCKLRPELAADAQQTAWWKCRLKSSQYTLIIPHRVIQLTTISFWVLRDKAAPSTSQHKSTNKQIPFEASEEPSDTVIYFYFCFFLHLQESSALSQSEAMIVQ